MNNAKNDYVPDEGKDLPKEASPRQRLKRMKEIALFHKGLFGDMSYNNIQNFIDKMIKVSDDKNFS